MKPIRDLLKQIKSSPNPDQELTRHVFDSIPEEDKPKILSKAIKNSSGKVVPPQIYQGKVRDVIFCDEELLIVHSDRLSAFDCPVGLVPYKGSILTAISSFWFREASKIVPTHFIEQPHERILRVRRYDPIKLEVIVRRYLAGSMMRAYEKGERLFCGVRLPEGLKPYGRLPEPIITPTTKEAVFVHDENITPQEIIEKGLCSRSDWQQVTEMALKLFALGEHIYKEKGWLLVDTKYEFGKNQKGAIGLIDEIHTPDSSRLWIADTYQDRIKKSEIPDMLDKEIVRRYLMGQGFSGDGPVPKVPIEHLTSLSEVYLKVAETLEGKILLANQSAERIEYWDFIK